MDDIFTCDFLAAFIALSPMSYIIRLVLAGVAFGAAMNPDKVIARAIGIVWLIIAAAGFLIVGITNGTVVDIVFGLVAGGAAAYSLWHNRY